MSNDLGIHARSAALLAKTANQYRSEITVQKGENKINGKSIIGILTLAAAKGSRIKITAEGVDAEEAVRGLKELVKSKFGEE